MIRITIIFYLFEKKMYTKNMNLILRHQISAPCLNLMNVHLMLNI